MNDAERTSHGPDITPPAGELATVYEPRTPMTWWSVVAWMNVAWFLDDFATAAERAWSWWPGILGTTHTFESAALCALFIWFAFSQAVAKGAHAWPTKR